MDFITDSCCFCKGLKKSYKRCWQSISHQGSKHQLAKQLDHFLLPSHCPVNYYYQIPRQRCLHSVHAQFCTPWFYLTHEQVTSGVSSMWRKLQAEGNDVCNVLLALHVFTGCNTTSSFVRKAKTTHLLMSLLDIFCLLEALLSCHITCGSLGVHAIQKVVNHYNINVWHHAKFAGRFTQRPREVISSYNGDGISLLPSFRDALNMHKKS